MCEQGTARRRRIDCIIFIHDLSLFDEQIQFARPSFNISYIDGSEKRRKHPLLRHHEVRNCIIVMIVMRGRNTIIVDEKSKNERGVFIHLTQPRHRERESYLRGYNHSRNVVDLPFFFFCKTTFI